MALSTAIGAAVRRRNFTWATIWPLLALMVAGLVPTSPGAVRLSEFLAVNDGALRDEDGDTPGWIEVQNDSATPINLSGWHLTDNPTNLTKWTFPAVTLGGRGYLIVFASGKDRANGAAELHANFQLDKDGEFLALVMPDGVTIADAFSPAFPEQRVNVSFGRGRNTLVSPLVSAGANARVLIPTDGSLGDSWTAVGFNDGAWMAASTGVGFEAGSSPGGAGSGILAIDFDERGTAPSTQAGFSSFVINSNVSASAIQTNATTRVFGGISVTVSNTAPLGYDDRVRGTPANSGAFTESLLLRDFVFGRNTSDNGGLDVTIQGLAPLQSFSVTLWSYDSGSPGSRVADWYANGTLVRENYSFGGQTAPVSNDDYRFSFNVGSDAAGRIVLSGRRDSTSVNASGAADLGVFLNAFRITQPGYRSLIATDIGANMSNQSASAFIRIPFTIAAPNAYQTLKLRVKYDDGFVAYLNGQVVAARNAPPVPAWDSNATATHSILEALVYEEIVLDNTPGLLAAGQNVLAIHGLNSSAADTDFLIVPELHAVTITEFGDRYFKPPTPGADNQDGYVGFVEDTRFSVDRGFYDGPFTVAITGATAGAEIRWTTNGSAPTALNGAVYTGPILITNTTFLRAAAFKPGLIASDVDTHSYIFLRQVLRQPNSLPGYPTLWQASYPADYEMDPNVVNHPVYGPGLSNDLRALPTLSLVMEHDGLWGAVNGIYNHATSEGELWERAASAELIAPDGSTAFAVNCGVCMQGNASRDNVRTPKHSLRLLFKSELGPSKLRYPWFPGAVEQFDNIVLRACFTDSWSTRSSPADSINVLGQRYRPEDATYLRDVWCKDTFAAMGHLAARSTHVHLYINGLYWGLYNPSERQDASFFTEYLGGPEGAWDIIRDFSEVLAGTKAEWDQMIAIVNAGITTEAAYQTVRELVDVPILIDYMMLHIYAEAEDWPQHNWYAARRRATNGLPATKWLILPWDQEIICDQDYPRNRIDVENNDTPARIYARLRAWPEFRREFGDRIQAHLFNGGALAPSNNAARFQARVNSVFDAMVAESARWGDAREFATPGSAATGLTFTRNEWWLPELGKLFTNWFPNQHAIAVARFRAGTLYPSLNAPVFSQFGGAVSNGFSLVLSQGNPAGTIFFTVDGSDPREYGSGSVASSAQAYSEPVPLNATTSIRARVFNAGIWSALVEATFFPPQDLTRLALTEIMFHPLASSDSGSDELEFIELKNNGPDTLNLSGLTFSTGINFTFTNGTLLSPGGFFVLARHAVAFSGNYPGVTFHGIYTGRLDNGGETLTLSHPLGNKIFLVAYDDHAPWPITADGFGFSLVPLAATPLGAPDAGASWRASTNPGGSPGADDPATGIAAIVINEILTASVAPALDAIELFNPTLTNVNIGGWFLTDDPGNPTKFRITNGTVIAGGGYIVLDEGQFNATPGVGSSFSLSSHGDEVYLFSGDANTNLTGYSHGLSFDAASSGVSFGRYLNSQQEEQFPAQVSTSFEAPNSGPRVGPVVISEIHYHPAIGDEAFIELLNITAEEVPLYDPVHPGHTWRLAGLGYDFPLSLTIPPNAILLLVAGDPAAFRAKYSVPSGVRIVGPFSGALQQSGERLKLQRPDPPDGSGLGYITVDEVRYNDKAPWPPSADGGGPSLQRISATAYAEDPVNWTAATITPGRLNATTDADGDGLPDDWETAHGTNSGLADATADPDHDGLPNIDEYYAGTDPQSAESNLNVQTIRADSGLVTMQFPALANRTYTVLHATALAAVAPWMNLTNTEAHPTNWIVTVQDFPGTNRFYRLVTPRVP